MKIFQRWTDVLRVVVRGWRRLLSAISGSSRLTRPGGRLTSRGALAPGVRFTLHSPAPPQLFAVPEEVRRLLLEHRTQFINGVLFTELSRVAQENVVVSAHIIEESHDQLHHLLAVYPAIYLPANYQQDSRLPKRRE